MLDVFFLFVFLLLFALVKMILEKAIFAFLKIKVEIKINKKG